MKLKLGTGKTVELIEEYGPRQEMRAAELSKVSAQMDGAESLLLNYASVMVAVKTVDGKTIEDLTAGDGGAVSEKEMLLRFREAFTKGEWSQLNEAFDQVFEDPKEAALPAFQILS